MKVCNLEIGMLLEPVDEKFDFRHGAGSWLSVRKNPVYAWPKLYSKTRIVNTASKKFALYLGRRKDIGTHEETWTDRFVLFDNKVLGVDPASWRHIKIFAEIEVD